MLLRTNSANQRFSACVANPSRAVSSSNDTNTCMFDGGVRIQAIAFMDYRSSGSKADRRIKVQTTSRWQKCRVAHFPSFQRFQLAINAGMSCICCEGYNPPLIVHETGPGNLYVF